ncbi:MAG: TonB-dependent receptor plug domain-containing protein [Methylococcales bacterium]
MKLKSQLVAIGCIALSTGIACAETVKPIDNPKKIDEPVLLDTIIVKAQSENNPNQAFESFLSPSKIIRSRTATSDTAKMFDHTPGVSFSGGGGISSRIILNGMADDRVRVQIDGMNLISACGNHMNPALSYVAPSSVLSAQVLAGITPVSMGGDSIAGTIRVQSADPLYAEDGKKYLVMGQGSSFYRSNGNAWGGNISTTLANKNASLTYTGSTVESGNYKAGGNFTTKNVANANDVVSSSAYRAQNQSLSLALRNDDHEAIIKVGLQNIPYQGFPNVRMDLLGDDSWFANVSTKSKFDWGRLETRAYHEDVQHYMNFLPDKANRAVPSRNMPMNTYSINQGLSVKGIIDVTDKHQLTLGSEYQRYRLDDWWQPIGNKPMTMMNGPSPFVNINHGQRDRLDFFAEVESKWNDKWLTQFGVRGGLVEMSAGDVKDYGVVTPEAALVNNQDKQRTDAIVDVTALARYTPTDTQQYELGFARKTRAPSLYERFAWSRGLIMGANTMPMSMLMNNWYGDGNGYVGNNNLNPEVAYTVSGTANFHDAEQENWDVKVTPFYTYVDNYIDAGFCQAANGVTCANPAANITTPHGGGGFRLLQLGNYNAHLVGVNASGSKTLLQTEKYGSLSSRAILSYVRGRNQTSHDNLYQQMPLNSTLDLDYKWGGWTATVETKLVAAKDTVQAIRLEPKTAGYALLNLRTSYDWKYLRVDAGIENALDKNYNLPLGGVYLGEVAAAGTPIPGYGRSYNVGLTVTY